MEDKTEQSPKEYIVSVSGGNISADVMVKSKDDFIALDGLINTVKTEISNQPNTKP